METKLRFEAQTQKYKEDLEKKLTGLDERKRKKREDNERDLIKKFNFLTMQREDNYEKTQRFERIQDYLKQKKMEKINERMERIEKLQ